MLSRNLFFFIYLKYLSGARINQQNRAGISPIMIAACKGNVNVVKYLSSKDADLEYKDRNDQTIIHLAAKNDQSAVIHVSIIARLPCLMYHYRPC